jgi:hypothetical protein
MNRCLAFLFAVLVASITISSACVAQPSDWIRFTLERQTNNDRLKASFHHESKGRSDNNWSTGLRPSELFGLNLAGFYQPGSRPLAFAIVREAGRLDCAGNGGGSYASGNCRFAADAAFTQLLVRHGVGRPSQDQSFSLMAVNARRELIEAVAAARYPMPSIDDLTAMSALGVDGRYIADLASAGYRPQAIHSLVEFKALGITPEWIGGLNRVGYANLPANELVQLKALNITPEYIAGFDRIGYRHIPANTLVQLKALNITPEFVRSAVGTGSSLPPVDQLVEMKIFGSRRPR